MPQWPRNGNSTTTARVGLLGGFVLAASITLGAHSQSPVTPLSGTTGNVAVDATQDKVYNALNVVIVQTINGVEHVMDSTKALFAHGGQRTGFDALQGLDEGSTVIDRVGGQGLTTGEGVLTHVDRRRQQVTIQFANGTTETLQPAQGTAAKAGNDLSGASPGRPRVVIYSADDAGHKVAHVFRKVS